MSKRLLRISILVVLGLAVGCGGGDSDPIPGARTGSDEASGKDSKAAGDDVVVRVDFSRASREIARGILGYNSLWMFGGMGIQEKETGGYREDVLLDIERLGVRLLRYPGGTVSHTFHWSEAIGPSQARKAQTIPFLEDERFRGLVGGATDRPLFGPDEFLRFCDRLEIEPLLVCAFEEGTPREAAAWVAYVNGEPGDARVIGVDEKGRDWGTVGSWAEARVANGRREPYGVRWFEIGNELDLERFQRTAVEYADSYLAYRAAMRAVDESIRVGAVGHAHPGGIGHKDRVENTGRAWNATLFERCGKSLDYLCLHFYATRDTRREDALDVLADPIDHSRRLRAIRGAAREAIPGYDLPIAITEHAMDERSVGESGGAGNSSLRAALVVADTLMNCVRDDVILAALHVLRLQWRGAWNPFLHFGSMLEWRGAKIFMPQYHVMSLFAANLLDEAVDCEVRGPGFRPSFDPTLEVPYVAVLATRAGDSERASIFLVNKHPTRVGSVRVFATGAPPGDPKARVLTGSGPDANNLETPGVVPRPLKVTCVDGSLAVDLPPLSFSVLAFGTR